MTTLKIGLMKRPDIAKAMHESYVGREDWRRDHMGASIGGNKCDRFLWLSFRWAFEPSKSRDGRMLRLFQTGKREEKRIIENLRACGMEVTSPKRLTSKVSKHIGGQADGIVRNVPGCEGTPHILECKTHSQKSFDYLQSKGVRSAKWEHFVQMQLYMLWYELERALYVAQCKNTDDLYVQRLYFDREIAEAAERRMLSIVLADEPADRLDKDQPPCVLTSADGTRWPCDYYDLCHGTEVPHRACRSCISATPMPNGKWRCELLSKNLTKSDQRDGCTSHLSIPPMINAQVTHLDVDGHLVGFRYYFENGTEYKETKQ